MGRREALAVLLAVVVLAASAAGEAGAAKAKGKAKGKYRALFNFGDSLADAGNLIANGVPDILAEAGVPEGVVSILPGGRELGEALQAQPGLDMVSFTGGTEAGKAVMGVAAKNLQRMTLELGGKSAAIVRDEAALADPDLNAKDPGGFDRLMKAIDVARTAKEAAEMRWLELAERADALA